MNTIPNQQPASWINDRLPEYLWLGLILMNYDRTEGIEKAGKILKEISKINKSIIKPKFSIILSLCKLEQENIFNIICAEISPKLLAPLSVLYRNLNYPIFNNYFNFPEFLVKSRIDKLGEAIKRYYDHQSYEATDLRFIIASMMIFQDKLRVYKGSGIPEAFTNYPYTSHDDEKMRSYRPCIRVLEMIDVESPLDKSFIDFFWKEIGVKTDCKPLVMSFENKDEDMDFKTYIIDFQEKLNYILSEKKELSLVDDKFDVIMGSITFALKIFNDVIEKDIGDSILGRHACRTILETYINIKYLLRIELEHPNIWQEYKLYGIGKYKLPLLKERENNTNQGKTHFVEPLIDIIVNEIKWEEFVDIDLRYFDQKKIKEKFEEIGEKHLYDILYEYDNNFIHGFWGAIRESSMLHCDNAAHKYHSVPDINFQQKLPSANNDMYKIMDKFSKLLDKVF